MSKKGPELVGQLSTVVREVCDAFARLSDQPVNELTRAVLAKRIMACAEGGEENPEKWKAYALGGFMSRPNSPHEASGRGQR